MTVLNSQDFMKKYNFKNDTMVEVDLKTVCNFSIYPGDSIITTDKGFVNIDNGSMGGTR